MHHNRLVALLLALFLSGPALLAGNDPFGKTVVQIPFQSPGRQFVFSLHTDMADFSQSVSLQNTIKGFSKNGKGTDCLSFSPIQSRKVDIRPVRSGRVPGGKAWLGWGIWSVMNRNFVAASEYGRALHPQNGTMGVYLCLGISF
jgi:hypothetical protein